MFAGNDITASKGLIHYAIIYIDTEGQIHQRVSPSIAGFENSIFTSRTTAAFVEAVKPRLEGKTSDLHSEFHGLSPTNSISTHEMRGQNIAQRQSEIDEHAYTLVPVAAKQLATLSAAKWQNQDNFVPGNPLQLSKRHIYSQNDMSWLHDETWLYLYYKSAFERFNQINCRILAKAFIKLVEPRKQNKFPYNGRVYVAGVLKELSPGLTKPPWWPVGVRHREPDHLLKAERIQLLIYLVRGLLFSHGISTSKLRDADRAIRHQIVPADRLLVLDDIYQIREAEVAVLEKAAVSHTQEQQCSFKKDAYFQNAGFADLSFAEKLQSEDLGMQGFDWAQDNIDVTNLIVKRRALKRKHHHME